MSLAMKSAEPACRTAVPGLDIAGRSLYCRNRRVILTISSGRAAGPASLRRRGGRGWARDLGRPADDRAGLLRGRGQPAHAEAVCDVNRLLYQDTAASGSFVPLSIGLDSPPKLE
jgi:hypothetical protein